MKTTFTLSLFFILHLCIAQSPVLTGASSNLQIGESLTAQGFAYVAPGSAGANQTWDFSAITSPGTATFTTLNPATTTNSASFPSATVATLQTVPSPTYNYYSASANSFNAEGYAYSNGMVLIYSNVAKQMSYPFALDSSFTDTYTGTYVSGGNTITRTGTMTVTADAYGTLILPYGTINNVLRVLSVDNFTETGNANTSTTTIYSWYLPGVHYPVLQLSTVSFNGTTVSQSGSYLDQLSSAPFLAAPSNLSAVVFKTEASYVQLNWTDNSDNETGFKIERGLNDSVFTVIDSVTANIATYNDNAIAQSTAYYYRVFAYNSARNSAVSNTMTANTGTTGIAATDNQQPQLYPNPVENILHLQNLNENAWVKLCDVTGQVLYQQKTNASALQIDMSNYSHGVYLVEIAQGTRVSVVKVIR